jgi:hypothetical protein
LITLNKTGYFGRPKLSQDKHILRSTRNSPQPANQKVISTYSYQYNNARTFSSVPALHDLTYQHRLHHVEFSIPQAHLVGNPVLSV